MSFFRRNPDFLLIWAGQVLSQSGGRMYQMAMIWWLLASRPTGTGKLIGFFMVLTALPSLLLVKRIGQTVDRLPSRRILVTADLLATLVVGGVGVLVWLGALSLPVAFAAGLLAATLQAFLDPTLNKAVAEVVEKDSVERAVSLLATTQSLANFAGAVAGAMLIDRVGIGGTAKLAALGYLVSASLSWIARYRYAVPVVVDNLPAESGWQLMAQMPFLKKVLLGFGFINFFSTPTLVVLPLYTKKTLGASASVLGSLEACLWVGLFIGSILASQVNFISSRIRLGALCLFTLGVGLAIPSVITDVRVYGVALLVAGFALGVNNVKFIAFFQEVVAPEWKGRFFALLQATISFTFPIAYFFFGALTDYLNPPTVCLIQGVGVCTLALYFLTLAAEEPVPAKVAPCL